MLLFINKNMKDHPGYVNMAQDVELDPTQDVSDEQMYLPFANPDAESEWELAGCPNIPSTFRAPAVPEAVGMDTSFSSSQLSQSSQDSSLGLSQSSTSTGSAQTGPPLPSLLGALGLIKAESDE